MQGPEIKPQAHLTGGGTANLQGDVSCKRGGRYDLVGVSVVNPQKGTLHIDRIRLFRLDLGTPTLQVFRQGFVMPSDHAGFHVLKAGEKAPYIGPWKLDCLSAWESLSRTMTVFRDHREMGQIVSR